MVCLIIVIQAGSSVPVSAQWESARKLSLTDTTARLNENMGRCLAVNGDTLHTVWYDANRNDNAICYRHSVDAGVSWAPEIRLTNAPGIADFPSVAVSGAFVHVAYRDTGNGQNASFYKRSTDGGTTWGSNVSLGGFYWWPSITSSGSSVYVALNANDSGNSEVYLRRSLDNGGTWDPIQRISNAAGRSEDPTLVAVDGYVHLAWNDNRTGIMQTFYRRSTDEGATWELETQLTHSTVFAYCPQLHASGPDVDLVWGDRRNGDYDIYWMHSSDHGASWGEEIRMSQDAAVSIYPAFARDDSNLHLVWLNASADIIYIHSSDDGSHWDTPFSIVAASKKPSNPFIALSDSAVHVLWADRRDGYAEIYYTRNPTGNTHTTAVDPEELDHLSSASLSIFPNPVMTRAIISFHLQVRENVRLELFDSFGRKTTTLVNAALNAGDHHVEFARPARSDFSPGASFIVLRSNERMAVHTMVLLR